MKSQFSLGSDATNPSLSAAITFGGSAAVFLVLSFTDGRLLFSFLFAVSFLVCVWEVRGLLCEKNERGRNARQYSEAEYQALGIARPQRREYGKSQKVIETVLSLTAGVLLLYAFTGNNAAVERVLGAALPLVMILLDGNAVRFTWQEIRTQTFRLFVYALSLALFLYHLLTALGIISIQSLIPEQVRLEVNLLLNLAFAPLLLATVYFVIRDTWRRMYDKPL